MNDEKKINNMKPGGFRLHIDIEIPEIKRPFPEVSCTQLDALDTSKKIIDYLIDNFHSAKVLRGLGISEVNYRLGHDMDKQKSNYFKKNANGHVDNKKSKIVIIPPPNVDSEQV